MDLKRHLIKNKGRFGFTMILILLETTAWLLFPLFIGYAIDSALQGNNYGLISLGVLGISALLIGSGRRFFDSRVYARIYQEVTYEFANKPSSKSHSQKSAQITLLREVLEFFENSLPDLANNVIGFIGGLIIISTLNWNIFLASLTLALTTVVIYAISMKKTILYNTNYNDEFEQRGSIVAKENPSILGKHIKRLMKWNIKLSDLETVNYSLVWIFCIGLLTYSIFTLTQNSTLESGAIFALIMYVFQYIEGNISLPLYYQQWLRLKEITNRVQS